MIAYQTAAPGAPLQRVDVPTPQPQGTEVLLRTVACGVCHSDVHLHDGAFDLGGGKRLDVARQGLTLGHEIFGEVVALGVDADGEGDIKVGVKIGAKIGAKIGDRRVVYPWIGCGDCAVCARGDEHLCTPGAALGIVQDGGFADHVLVPHPRYLFDKGDVPDPLAATYACSGLTAYSALNKLGRPGPGDELVIIGGGGVGMMAVQIALAKGIDPIVADIDPARLEGVKNLGVSRVFDSSDPQPGKGLRKLSGGGAWAAIDFVGSEASVDCGLGCLRKGGTLVIVGLYGGALNVPIPFIPMNARIIRGSYVGSLSEMAELMALVRRGSIAPIPLQQRPLSEATNALTDLKAGRITGRQVLMV